MHSYTRALSLEHNIVRVLWGGKESRRFFVVAMIVTIIVKMGVSTRRLATVWHFDGSLVSACSTACFWTRRLSSACSRRRSNSVGKKTMIRMVMMLMIITMMFKQNLIGSSGFVIVSLIGFCIWINIIIGSDGGTTALVALQQAGGDKFFTNCDKITTIGR